MLVYNVFYKFNLKSVIKINNVSKWGVTLILFYSLVHFFTHMINKSLAEGVFSINVKTSKVCYFRKKRGEISP